MNRLWVEHNTGSIQLGVLSHHQAWKVYQNTYIALLKPQYKTLKESYVISFVCGWILAPGDQQR